MDQRQINQLNMLEGVLTHFDNNEPLWLTKVPVARDVAALRFVVTEIRNSSLLQQQSNTMGYTAQKNAALDKILDETLDVALQVKDFAIEKEDLALKAAVDFSETALGDGPEKEIINRCEIIVKNAIAHITDLAAAGYELTSANMTALLADIEAEKVLWAKRDVVGGTRTGITASLPELMAKAKAILKKLDGLVRSMIKDKAFTNTYEALRFINNRRGGGGNDSPTPPEV